MAFKLLEKKWGISGLEHNEVSVSKTAISFGDDFKALILKHKYMEVYLDKDDNLIGFKPCDDVATGYKIQFDKTSKTTKRPSVTSSKVTKLIPLGRYNAKLENDIIVFKVAEFLDNKPQVTN